MSNNGLRWFRQYGKFCMNVLRRVRFWKITSTSWNVEYFMVSKSFSFYFSQLVLSHFDVSDVRTASKVGRAQVEVERVQRKSSWRREDVGESPCQALWPHQCRWKLIDSFTKFTQLHCISLVSSCVIMKSSSTYKAFCFQLVMARNP